MDLGRKKLEGFVALAKNVEGGGNVMLIQQVIRDPAIFVFGELLETDSIQKLEGTEFVPHLNLLQLFAYGTYQDYKKRSDLPKLSEKETRKLKQLSLVSLAAQHKSLPYDLLLRELELSNLRELEDLIIDSVYTGLVQGKLDQNRGIFDVQFTTGRDIGPGDVQGMMNKLKLWIESSQQVVETLEKKINNSKMLEKQQEEETKKMEAQKRDIIASIKVQQDQSQDQGGLGDVMSIMGGGMVGNMMGAMMGGGPGGRHRMGRQGRMRMGRN